MRSSTPILRLVSMTALCFAGASAVRAQSMINVGIGAAIPIGSTADLLNPGYNAAFSYARQLPWLNANYLRLEVGTNSLTERAVPDTKRQVTSVTLNVVIIGEPKPGPRGYVVLGAGTYQKSGAVPRHSDPGINVGTGIRFSMGFFGTFVEARLHYVNDDEKTKYFPMTFGLTY